MLLQAGILQLKTNLTNAEALRTQRNAAKNELAVGPTWCLRRKETISALLRGLCLSAFVSPGFDCVFPARNPPPHVGGYGFRNAIFADTQPHVMPQSKPAAWA